MNQIHSKHLYQTLRATNDNVVMVEPFLINGIEDAIAWQDGMVRWRGIDISPSQVHSVFLSSRPSDFPLEYVFDRAPSHSLNWSEWFQEYGLQRDRADTLLGVLMAYERAGVPMLNAPSQSNQSRRKPYQINVMQSVGCPMPETLVTNSFQQAKEFIKQYQSVIVKPAAGGALTINAHKLDDIHLQELKRAPGIFQRRIDGKDLRIMVLDQRIISSASIDVPEGTLDFRGDATYAQGQSSYTPITLPVDIQALCLKAADALGLRYTGIDIKMTDKGEYYFLECNSGPMYLDVERKLGDPITQHLCEALRKLAHEIPYYSKRYHP